MWAINDKALAKFKGILEVRPAWSNDVFTRLASVRWLISNLDTTNVIDIKADDTGSVYKVTDVKATVEAEMLEIFDRDTLKLLFTWTSEDIAAAEVSVSDEALWTWWTVGTPITLKNKNGNNTEVSDIVVKADGDELTKDTDYAVYVDEDGYTNITPLTSQDDKELTADYKYTPNASENISISIDSTEVKSFEVKITAVEWDKIRVINLSSAAFNSAYWLSFADVVEQWDITWATLTFDANKWSVFTYTNEIL